MKLITATIAFVWIVLLAALSGITLWNLSNAAPSKSQEKADFRGRLRGMLLDKCAFHDEMIHLYGGWARVSGRSVCNGVLRHKSGMLINSRLTYTDATNRARRLKALYNNLTSSGKSLLYVQVPRKIDRDCKMLPRGFAQDFSHESVDGLLKTLDLLGVPFLDVRGMLDLTPEAVQKYFFKTDHHWNFDGAFKVFPLIAKTLAISAGAESSDIAPYVSPDAWERKKLPRRFLGTDGRRTGALFADMDDIFYYVPKFSTSISRECPSKKILRKGAFEESVIDIKLAEKPPSMFMDCGYNIYGSDYDYVKYSNDLAPIKKRIIVAKDSFALPIVAWLSTIFERIDVIDLRLYSQMTLTEAAIAFDSNVVVIMYNPMALSGSHDKLWDWDDSGEFKAVGLQYPPRDVFLPTSNHPYNNVLFEEGLVANGLYKVSAKSVEITSGTADKVTIALLNKKTGKAIKRANLPLNSAEWIINVPNDDQGYAIILYAGESGRCSGVGAIWHDVELLRIK